MSCDDRCPPWIRVSTSNMTTVEGRYILGGRSAREFADYGRYFALIQLVARTPQGYIDVGDARRLKSLAADLGMTPKACRDWLAVLVEGGAIDAECYEARGWVFMPDVYNQVQSYQGQVAANRRNGAKGGRPRKQKTETKPNGKPNGLSIA